MKLFTQIDKPYDEVKADLLTDGDSDVSPIDQLEHDALAAHALMQAIDEYDASILSHDDIFERIRERADELMREWTKQDEVK